MVAGDIAGARAFPRHHEGIHGHGGDRRIVVAAGSPHHFVQALAFAHRRQAIDLAREQRRRRAAVGRRRHQLAHEHLELQITQRTAARRGRQGRHQALGVGERGAVPGIGRQASGGGNEKAGRIVVEVLRFGWRARGKHDGKQQQASAQSVHWAPAPRNASPADAARAAPAPPDRSARGRPRRRSSAAPAATRTAANDLWNGRWARGATYLSSPKAAILTTIGVRRSLESSSGMRDIQGLGSVMDFPFPLSLPRTVALVGLMGAGKSAIGKRLALRLGLPFVDADDEIERAAGCSISEFFERFGEVEFRAGERRVISRLLAGPPHVLSTGGGAYMDAETRALMRKHAITVWLRADLEVLYDRVRKRAHRPLLRQGDPREILERLISQRYPIYAEADLVIESTAQPAEITTDQVLEALRRHLEPHPAGAAA